jgi:hypothetical protein
MWEGKLPCPLFSAQCRDSCRRGWRINPYMPVRGADFSLQAVPPNPSKRGGVFLSTLWAQEASVCAAKTHPRGPNKHLPVFSHKMAAISPNFLEEKGGGPHNFTDSFARVILEFSWINKDFSRSKCSRNFPGGYNNDVGVVSAKSVHSRSVHSRYNVHPERYLRSYLC